MPYTAYYTKVGQVRGVQIDLNPARIGLRYLVEVGLTGDTRETIRALLPLLKRNGNRSFLAQAQVDIARWHAMLAEQESSEAVPMRPQVFAGAISKAIADDAMPNKHNASSGCSCTPIACSRHSARAL